MVKRWRCDAAGGVLRWRAMTRRPWRLLPSLLAVICLVAAVRPVAGAQAEPTPNPNAKTGGTLTVALDGEIDTIDPQKSVTIVAGQVERQLYEGLVVATPTLDGVVPLLAESWDITPDGLSYTFHLRHGVRFHNGKDFKAEDVKWTFDRVMDKNFGSPRRPSFTSVDHLDVLDDYTVRFVMAKPFAPLLTNLDVLFIQPMSSDIDFSKTPVGTGPYKFVDWVSGDHISLVKNPDYWQTGKPYLDGVTFRPVVEPSTRVVDLRSGNVDLLNAVPLDQVSTLRQDGSVQVWQTSGVVRDHVGFNMSAPPFKDNPNLRKAIAWAVDRQTIADQLLFGLAKPAQIPVPETNWGYTTELTNPAGYDLTKAKEYYDQANPKPTDVTVKVSPTYPDEVKMAELMQQSLAQIGLNLNIQQLEWSTWIKDVVTDGNYQMEIVLISGGIDPDDFYYQWLHSGEVFNITRYSDPGADALMEQARGTLDQAQRKPLYDQIANKMLDDVPWSHIIYRQSVMAGSAALKDFVMTGRYDMDFRSVWLDR
jgi:peptide/nickel transport system substrate-binding protein